MDKLRFIKKKFATKTNLKTDKSPLPPATILFVATLLDILQ